MPFIKSSGRTIEMKLVKPLVHREYLASSLLGAYEQLKLSLEYSASKSDSGKIQCFDFGAGRSHKIHYVLADIAERISTYVPIDILPSILLRGYYERNQRSTYRYLSVYGDMEKLDLNLLGLLIDSNVPPVAVSAGGMFPFLSSDCLAKILRQLMEAGCTSGFHLEADAYTHFPGVQLGYPMLAFGLGQIPISGYFNNLNISYITDFQAGSYGSGSKSATESEAVARDSESALVTGLDKLHRELDGFSYNLFLPLQPLTGIPLTFYEWKYGEHVVG